MATARYFLDAARPDARGRCAVRMTVRHSDSSSSITMPLRVEPRQWDAALQRVRAHPDSKALNRSLGLWMALALHELGAWELEHPRAPEKAPALCEMVRARIFPEAAPRGPRNGVAEWLGRFASHKKGRTRELYLSTGRRLEAYAGERWPLLRFEEVGTDWLMGFDDFLGRTSPSANARGIHLRNLRAVFNFAIDNGATSAYPFRRYRIKTAPTRKRALSVEQLRLVMTAPAPPALARWRDLFSLTFLLLGINFADLCALRSVEGGRVDYVRRKTHKAYSVPVLPEAMEIISRYRGRGQLLDYLDRSPDYRTYYQGVVRGLHRLTDWLNARHPGAALPPLSTYRARHSWATAAASLDIPKETIARALGHGDRSVTDIYIDFDMGKVDRAARMVADLVLGGPGKRPVSDKAETYDL